MIVPASTRCLVLCVLVMLSLSAAAEDLPAVVQQIQTASYGDDFGQKVINWVSFGTDTPIWGNKSLLSAVALFLNGIALIVMGWLAVAGGAAFVIHTANKGVPGGQVISSFWMPIRIGVATILLIPLTSGYSTLQYGVITVAEKGSAHGNLVMRAGLDYLYDFGAYRPGLLPSSRDAILSWLEAEVCRQYINSYTRRETIRPHQFSELRDGNYTTGVSYDYDESNTWHYNKNDLRLGYCGAIAYSMVAPSRITTPNSRFDADQGKTTAAYAGPEIIAGKQFEIIKTFQPRVAEIAALILSDESALRQMQVSGQSAQSNYERAVMELNGKINTAAYQLADLINDYDAHLQSIMAQTVNQLNDAKNSGESWREQTIKIGWPALGTIFWQINTAQSEINKLSASLIPIFSEPNLDEDWIKDQRLTEVSSRIRGLKKAAATYGSVDNGSPEGPIPSLSAIADSGAEGSGLIDGIKKKVYQVFAWSIRSVLFKNSPDDLVINLQYFGSATGTFAESAFWSKIIAVSMTQGYLEAIDNSVTNEANSFSKYNPLGWAAKGIATAASGASKGAIRILGAVSEMLDTLLIALVVVGFLLGIVLPTIPMILWFMGVISWMLFFIECLIVSPMWLAAHGTAEREGWGTEHTRQGYMLMIGLYLNPILRVAGFFAIFLALKPVSYLVSWLIDYIQGVVISGFALLYIYVGSMVVIAIFAYTVLVRIYGLPAELFERGLRWVNGGQEVTGDSSNEEKARSNLAIFSSKGEAAASRVGRTSMSVSPGKPEGGSGDGGGRPRGTLS
ncbi:DotA/TraY family protein [Phytopseudomonas daroniae]|uniref:DotA/TraY family protein n=1 Tax=Phytopseudomonas daroniae TaxID=2487519 RepID=UPI00103855AF|nr:DotA/TraY family protein [Pseudomonas daroniae]TBU77183.1 hypothetical protein DNK10_06650 [Pseudomonas daroniae]